MFWLTFFLAWCVVVLLALWIVALARCRRLAWERDRAREAAYQRGKRDGTDTLLMETSSREGLIRRAELVNQMLEAQGKEPVFNVISLRRAMPGIKEPVRYGSINPAVYDLPVFKKP